LLHALGREVWTLESDADWLKRFDALASQRHTLVPIADWNALADFQREGQKWGVVFVDFGGEQFALRGWAAALFRDSAQFVVCHDSGTARYYGYNTAFGQFAHRAEYSRWPSKTTMILSNLREIPPLESLEILA
jgi:hypothetical protein